ncbi:MAG: CpsB/CapC family capsule biosynthesis tyrosine phosphatase [Acidobacteriota bacterium]
MIDIHSHVLPGVDDGAEDLREALEMCRLAAADGVEVMVTTPHQRSPHWANDDAEWLHRRRAKLQEEVGRTPRLLPGGEIRVNDELLDELADPGAVDLLPLAGSRYLLLELDRHDPRQDAEGLTHELVLEGWRPIFAHPEFIPALRDDLPLMHRLQAMGASFQITAMCLTGQVGRSARERCTRMIDQGLVQFVASDAHGIEWRPPGLSGARRAIASTWGESLARDLTEINPLAVVENRPLPVSARFSQ